MAAYPIMTLVDDEIFEFDPSEGLAGQGVTLQHRFLDHEYVNRPWVSLLCPFFDVGHSEIRGELLPFDKPCSDQVSAQPIHVSAFVNLGIVTL